MFNSLTSQQQQVVNQQLSIEQLLRAAKLIEQRAIIEKLPSHFDGYNSAKFGEKYEARILAPKLRTFIGDPNIGQSSTGSSQRSSPLSATSSPSPDLTVLACLHSPHQHYQQTQQQLTLIDSQQQRQSTSNLSSSSIASSSSMITTDAQRLSISLDGNLSPSASHGSGRRASASRQSRAAHNELEKNRRANLRGHLEALKSVLPPESDVHRDTTLSLLTRARNYIQSVEEQKVELIKKKEALLVEHQRLKNLLLKQQKGNEEPERNGENLINLNNESNLKESNVQQISYEEKEKNLNFDQFCAKKEHKKEENNNKKSKVDEYLSLNGLIPSLPLLYPYSFNNNNNMAGTA